MSEWGFWLQRPVSHATVFTGWTGRDSALGFKDKLQWGDGKEPVNSDFSGRYFPFFNLSHWLERLFTKCNWNATQTSALTLKLRERSSGLSTGISGTCWSPQLELPSCFKTSYRNHFKQIHPLISLLRKVVLFYVDFLRLEWMYNKQTVLLFLMYPDSWGSQA